MRTSVSRCGGFDTLYRQHCDAAWRTAYALVRNPDDARDAVAEAFTRICHSSPEPAHFRPYLLAAVRNASIDILRRSRRQVLSEDPAPERGDFETRGPADRVVAREDQTIVMQAYGRLPQRWQLALWLIDVEGLSTLEAGRVLEVSPNNAAQLATRARRRLREEYLQAHVSNHLRDECRPTVDALGSYVAGSAPAMRRSAVEGHLAGCAECTNRRAELEDLGVALRRSIPPLPLALASVEPARRMAGGIWRWLWSSPGSGPMPAPMPVTVVAAQQGMTVATPVLERMLAGASAVVVAAGVFGWTVRHAPADRPSGPAGLPQVALATPPANRPGPGTTSSPAPAPGVPTPGPGPEAPVSRGVAAAVPAALPGAPIQARVHQPASEASPTRPPQPDTSPPAPVPPGTPAAVAGPGAPAPAVPGRDGPAVVPLTGAATALTAPSGPQAVLPPPDVPQTELPPAPLPGTGAVLPVPPGGLASLPPAPLPGAGAVLPPAHLPAPGPALPTASPAPVDLSHADLSGADLSGAALAGANLSGANLSGANLSGANLSGANLSGANLSGAELSGANLSGADLHGAELSGADLSQADLTGADVSHTVLAGANQAATTLASSPPQPAQVVGTAVSPTAAAAGVAAAGAPAAALALVGSPLPVLGPPG